MDSMDFETTDECLALRTKDLDRFMLRYGVGWSATVDLRRGGRVVTYVAALFGVNDLVLKHRNNHGEEYEETIAIEYGPCHFGGRRPWFICPDCRRRKTVLFSAGYFRCRRCAGLAYASQQGSKVERPLNRLIRQRVKLGGSTSIYEPFPPRPKDMPRETYSRLREEDERNRWKYKEGVLAALERSVSSVIKRQEKRASQSSPASKKKPKRAPAATTTSDDELAILFGLLPKGETRSSGGGS
jgi:hypothetical protein